MTNVDDEKQITVPLDKIEALKNKLQQKEVRDHMSSLYTISQ